MGRLTGKIRRNTGIPDNTRISTKLMAQDGPQVPLEHLYTVVEAIDEIGKETGKTVPQIALNWLLRRPTISSVIVGARGVEQLKQNLGAVGWELTREQVAKLDQASDLPRAYPVWKQAGFERSGYPPHQ
jgi:aryl-alcohol dehydrogenase-like predicted oxidoreductase